MYILGLINVSLSRCFYVLASSSDFKLPGLSGIRFLKSVHAFQLKLKKKQKKTIHSGQFCYKKGNSKALVLNVKTKQLYNMYPIDLNSVKPSPNFHLPGLFLFVVVLLDKNTIWECKATGLM